ncbi:Fur family transcriptional regulator [Pseudobacteriovorax antillogorgiicola]|nr:transcriptional repressor [Pseudobacteriovorax antillogorgiicola]
MKKKKLDYTWFWEQLDAYLERANLKHSKQRNSIIEYFLDLDDHVSAEDLHTYAKDQGATAGMATIYRTLNLLKDAGLVDQKQFSDGKAVFELNRPDSHHDHLICTVCGKVVEFENSQIERLQEEVAKKYGMRLTHHSLDLFGVCERPKCKGRK